MSHCPHVCLDLSPGRSISQCHYAAARSAMPKYQTLIVVQTGTGRAHTVQLHKLTRLGGRCGVTGEELEYTCCIFQDLHLGQYCYEFNPVALSNSYML